MPLSDPDFALGHTAALRIGAGLAAAATVVAAITFGPLQIRLGSRPTPKRN